MSGLKNHILNWALVVLVVTWVAEKAMMSVDIECLESLKYEYKGA